MKRNDLLTQEGAVASLPTMLASLELFRAAGEVCSVVGPFVSRIQDLIDRSGAAAGVPPPGVYMSRRVGPCSARAPMCLDGFRMLLAYSSRRASSDFATPKAPYLQVVLRESNRDLPATSIRAPLCSDEPAGPASCEAWYRPRRRPARGGGRGRAECTSLAEAVVVHASHRHPQRPRGHPKSCLERWNVIESAYPPGMTSGLFLATSLQSARKCDRRPLSAATAQRPMRHRSWD
jgi:hypothetical protein